MCFAGIFLPEYGTGYSDGQLQHPEVKHYRRHRGVSHQHGPVRCQWHLQLQLHRRVPVSSGSTRTASGVPGLGCEQLLRPIRQRTHDRVCAWRAQQRGGRHHLGQLHREWNLFRGGRGHYRFQGPRMPDVPGLAGHGSYWDAPGKILPENVDFCQALREGLLVPVKIFLASVQHESSFGSNQSAC